MAWPRLREKVIVPLAARGASVWGAFQGLFGIASSDVVVLTQSANGDARPVVAPPDFTVREQYPLAATVRPAVPAATLERPGLYVFRFFNADAEHVDEIVHLSNEAWTTFERTSDYASQPQGLFRPLERVPGPVRLLLLTWYDGFASWERSRRPAPAAVRNFQRRQALTRGTIAFATRLIDMD
jgi:hypothetical protein